MNRNMRRTACLLLPFFMLMPLLTGCRNVVRSFPVSVAYITNPQDAGSISSVATESHSLTEGLGTEEEIAELLNLVTAQPRSGKLSSAFPENVTILEFSVSSQTLEILLSESYNRMDAQSKVLLRYCLCRTVLENTHVSRVKIRVAGITVYDSLCGDSYLTELDTLREVDYNLMIYWPDPESDGLSVDRTDLMLTADQDPAYVLLQTLAGGHLLDNGTTYRFIDPDTEILSVTTSFGICYIDLSSEFLDTNVTSSDGTSLTLYAIVNTLCSLPEISQVQFLIEGEPQQSYMHTAFDSPISPDDTIAAYSGFSPASR